jgi:ribosomal protein L37AE/L43A
MLAATVCAVIFVRQGLDRTFAWTLAALLGTILAWMLVSVFWPAKADRTCPTCGSPALRRSDRRTTRGVVCDQCGHEDADQSSFLMAEDEGGAIESIVIAERDGRRGWTR